MLSATHHPPPPRRAPGRVQTRRGCVRACAVIQNERKLPGPGGDGRADKRWPLGALPGHGSAPHARIDLAASSTRGLEIAGCQRCGRALAGVSAG